MAPLVNSVIGLVFRRAIEFGFLEDYRLRILEGYILIILQHC